MDGYGSSVEVGWFPGVSVLLRTVDYYGTCRRWVSLPDSEGSLPCLLNPSVPKGRVSRPRQTPHSSPVFRIGRPVLRKLLCGNNGSGVATSSVVGQCP